MSLFVTAMIAGGIGLAGFFVAFAGVARGSTAIRSLSSLGAGLGILAALGFVGVA